MESWRILEQTAHLLGADHYHAIALPQSAPKGQQEHPSSRAPGMWHGAASALLPAGTSLRASSRGKAVPLGQRSMAAVISNKQIKARKQTYSPSAHLHEFTEIFYEDQHPGCLSKLNSLLGKDTILLLGTEGVCCCRVTADRDGEHQGALRGAALCP